MLKIRNIGILFLFGFSFLHVNAQPTTESNAKVISIEKSIVYIECTSPDGKLKIPGTGVLVSASGRILTAKHVAPTGYNCLGQIGTAASQPVRQLIRDTRQANVDALLFRFVGEPGEVFEFLRYRRIETTLRAKSILAHGFPIGGVGSVDTVDGIIRNTTIDGRGIISTSATTSSGMSGGPVILKDDGSLIGIIVGADFDPSTGSPKSFGVLAAEEVAVSFELTSIIPEQSASSIKQPKKATRREVQFGPFTLAPGEARSFSVKMLESGPLDVTVDNLAPEIGLSRNISTITPELAIRICTSESSVDTSCPHSQVGLRGVIRKHLPDGPGNISIFNFTTNPKVVFSVRAEGPI